MCGCKLFVPAKRLQRETPCRSTSYLSKIVEKVSHVEVTLYTSQNTLILLVQALHKPAIYHFQSCSTQTLMRVPTGYVRGNLWPTGGVQIYLKAYILRWHPAGNTRGLLSRHEEGLPISLIMHKKFSRYIPSCYKIQIQQLDEATRPRSIKYLSQNLRYTTFLWPLVSKGADFERALAIVDYTSTFALNLEQQSLKLSFSRPWGMWEEIVACDSDYHF